MSELQFISNLSAEKLREEVKVEYTEVALDPDKGYHFHTGRDAVIRLGYDLNFARVGGFHMQGRLDFSSLNDFFLKLKVEKRYLKWKI
jgi:hypothetical protein